MVRMKSVCISDDLHIEILQRLPVKSLLRFKSVCKQWRSLISSRRFSVLHTLRQSTSTAAAVLVRRWDLNYYHLSLSKTTPFALPGYVTQSCNGLLLCRCLENAPSDYCIYNPAIGPSRTLDYVHNDDESLTLAFDPSKSAYYKLVLVKAADSPPLPFRYQIVVFDSESSSWSVAVENFMAPRGTHFHGVRWNSGVYWNNAVHWNMILGGLFYFDNDKGTIGQAPEIEMTHLLGVTSSTFFLMESGGHLHFILSGGSKLRLFEMERDYSKWSIKYQVEYGGISYNFMHVSVIGVMRAQNEEESSVLFYVSGKLMVYNRTDESFQELTDLGMEEFNMENPSYFGPYDVHQFVETLAPV